MWCILFKSSRCYGESSEVRSMSLENSKGGRVSLALFSDRLPLLLLRPDGAGFWGFWCRREAIVDTVKAFSAHWAGIMLREAEKNVLICTQKVSGITASKAYSEKTLVWFLCCRHSPQFRMCDTLKNVVTNPTDLQTLQPTDHIHSSSLPSPAKALYIHCGSNGGRVASWQIPLMGTPPYKLDTPVCSLGGNRTEGMSVCARKRDTNTHREKQIQKTQS